MNNLIQKANAALAFFSTREHEIVITDSKSNILLANKPFRDLFGYKYSEIEGKSIQDLIADTRPHPHAEDMSVLFKQGLPRRFNIQGVVLGRKKDGTEFNVHISQRDGFWVDNQLFLSCVARRVDD